MSSYQREYQKKRRATDPEYAAKYRAKRALKVHARQKKRRETDPAYAARVREYQRQYQKQYHAKRKARTAVAEPGERWKPVAGLPGYWISSHGRVWSDKSHKILAQHPQRTNHYQSFTCWHAGGPHVRYVHLEVLKAFLGPKRAPDHEALHYPDQDRSNNRLDNLAWGTRAENLRQAREAGLVPERGGAGATSRLGVADVHWLMARRAEGLGPAALRRRLEAERGVRVSLSTLQRVATGHCWNHATGLPLRRYPSYSSAPARRRRAQAEKRRLAEGTPQVTPVFDGDRLVRLIDNTHASQT